MHIAGWFNKDRYLYCISCTVEHCIAYKSKYELNFNKTKQCVYYSLKKIIMILVILKRGQFMSFRICWIVCPWSLGGARTQTTVDWRHRAFVFVYIVFLQEVVWLYKIPNSTTDKLTKNWRKNGHLHFFSHRKYLQNFCICQFACFRAMFMMLKLLGLILGYIRICIRF